MRHLDDRRVCPHCRKALNERAYLMSRVATENVFSNATTAWIIVVILALVVLANA